LVLNELSKSGTSVKLNHESILSNNKTQVVTTSPKVKTMEREGIGVHFLTRNTLGQRSVLELQDGMRKINKQFNYSHGHAQIKQEVD